MLLVCPRCSGSLPPDARACPRCGLVLTGSTAVAQSAPVEVPATNGHDPYYTVQDAPVEGQTSPAPYVVQAEQPGTGTAPYAPAEPQPSFQVPVRPRSRDNKQ